MSLCTQRLFRYILRSLHKNHPVYTKKIHGHHCVISRTCSGSSSESDSNHGNSEICKTETSEDGAKVTTSQPGFLEGWYYGVQQFGTLDIDVPFNLHIQSLNPQKYPYMNKFYVTLLYDVDPSSIDKEYPQTLSALSRLYGLNIEKEDFKVTIDAKFKTETVFPVLCHIEMPMTFDVNIKSSGKTTFVENLENEKVQINSTSPECILKNVKSDNVDVHSEGGDIVCQKVIQGNINMKVEGNGNIKTDRLQGLAVNCSTDNGDISSTSIYACQSSFMSNKGNLKLANCHGESKIKIQKGNLVIDSLDGSMDAQVECGSTDVYVTKADNISIKTSDGSIKLKVPDTLQSSFELVGESVSVDPKLPFKTDTRVQCDGQTSIHGHMNNKDGSIVATTMKGDVSLEAQDWLSSLKLKVSS